MQFLACFLESLKLGFTSFGGPVAHLAYFREAYVGRLKWLSDEKFAELLAICQFILGPASSQLGAAIGYEKGGWLCLARLHIAVCCIDDFTDHRYAYLECL